MLAIKLAPSIADDAIETYRHRLNWHRLDGRPSQRYATYIPDGVQVGAPMMVCVHGVSHNVESQLYGFAPWADRFGIVLVAPLFDTLYFVKQQCLVKELFARRADDVLDAIVGEVGKQVRSVSDRLHLFGYSGGAQFVQRYAMLYPRKVDSFAAVSANSYIFPDETIAYPLGTRATAQIPEYAFMPKEYLQVPGTVFVDDGEASQEITHNSSPELIVRQGVNRAERGRRWVAAMNEQAESYGLDTLYRLEVLLGGGCTFESAMIDSDLGVRVMKALFPRL